MGGQKRLLGLLLLIQYLTSAVNLFKFHRALDLFSTLSPTHLYAHHIRVFLTVATDEPCTIADIAKQNGLSNSAVSRTINALGATNRKGEPGFDLVYAEPDPEEGRRDLIRLTSKGKALARSVDGV